ncbi:MULTISPECIES: Hsp20/alpha crystallin family protein [Aromatoleum]|uniref:Hsp20 family protein n=2 Tax=Aromatoleum TaxID=551759 RepID=A0ABX1NZK7_9RHOO|nr:MULTISPECIES: Hsp20/alpha crystallin family protein [Aromatoleum]MCK0507413.1 Hsp20/alpha crystallin family protein [Aromatoleum anaerobium]NMG16925.1 Hsp20 family protein [Aromatoleum bremense]QTQ31706.1 Putative 20kDa heat shock protein [Aromatoleum bremense]
MYESLLNFPGGLFADFDRLQRELQQAFGAVGQPSSIRAVASGTFPSINVGSTPGSVEIYAFAPGIDPSKLDVQIDRGVLTLSGERPSALPSGDERQAVYASERFSGRFRRTVSLPEDIDPDRVTANYRDGVLHISVSRRESAQPKRVEIK